MNSVNELLMCQAMALIRELWPDEFDVKPELRIVGGTPVKKTAPPAEEKSINAREEAVYLMARGMLLERFGVNGPKPKLILIQGGRAP